VAFGANRFVTVGELGTVQSSTDGINWTVHLTGFAYTLNDVVFANGKFVTVSSAGWIKVSPNGTDWTLVSSGVATGETGVTYGNGLFVAVGPSGTVLTSPDGNSWTKQSGISTSLALKSVCYGSSGFVAITGAGEIIQSPDGTNWTSQPSQGGTPSKVVYLNNQFVLVDYGVKVSSDGTNWGSPTYVYPVVTNITYGGGYYVGVGSGVGSGHGGVARYSPDLVTWTTAMDDAHSYGLSSVAYGNGLFVGVGMHGLIWTSPDHVTWTVRKQSLTYLGNLYAVAYIQNQFVVGGNGAVSPGGFGEDAPHLFGSVDGNWFRRPSGVFPDIWALGYGQGLYVEVNASTVRTSPDGITWTTRGSGLSTQLAGLDFDNNLFVLTAWGGGISTSPDGITWTIHTNNTTQNLWGAAYGNGIWVAAGQSFSGGGAYETSPDGTTWTRHTSTSNFRNVAFGGGVFVMVGDSGYLASSTTGTSWTVRGSGTAGSIYGVCYGDGYFVAVGNAGYLASSPDGTNWTPRTSGATVDLERVAYGGGTFVATGLGGLIIQSASTIPSIVSKRVTGGVELDLVGGFDRSYLIQTNGDLTQPGWSTLTTLPSGQRQFTDPDTSQPQKFYRVLVP
jgi:hypothetical protein